MQMMAIPTMSAIKQCAAVRKLTFTQKPLSLTPSEVVTANLYEHVCVSLDSEHINMNQSYCMVILKF